MGIALYLDMDHASITTSRDDGGRSTIDLSFPDGSTITLRQTTVDMIDWLETVLPEVVDHLVHAEQATPGPFDEVDAKLERIQGHVEQAMELATAPLPGTNEERRPGDMAPGGWVRVPIARHPDRWRQLDHLGPCPGELEHCVHAYWQDAGDPTLLDATHTYPYLTAEDFAMQENPTLSDGPEAA